MRRDWIASAGSLLVLGLVATGSGCDAPSDVVGRFEPSLSPDLDSPPPDDDVPQRDGGDVNVGGAGGATTPPPPRGQLALEGDLLVHDPSLIEADGRYTLFQFGEGAPFKTSADLLQWEQSGRAFSAPPASLAAVLPEATDLWAPDISFDGESYHLYYASSTFGTGESCIGHATTTDLRSGEWTDRPLVLCSNIDSTDEFDAVDPSALIDAEGGRWLVFGSYFTGIKLLALDSAGDADGTAPLPIAERPVEVAIQAAHVLYRAPYYYLIASFGRCCSGVNSTSTLQMGRATDVIGPYLDRDGVALLDGGGSLLLGSDDRYVAVGGPSSLRSRGVDYLAYHAYDADAAGQAVLRITEFTIDDDDWIALVD